MTALIELVQDDIKNILPHRDPFLFLDVVTITSPGKDGLSTLNMANIQDCVLAGPSINKEDILVELVLEAAAQLSGVVLSTQPNLPEGEDVQKLLLGFDDVVVTACPKSAELITLSTTVLSEFKGMYQCAFEALSPCGLNISGKLNVLNGVAS